MALRSERERGTSLSRRKARERGGDAAITVLIQVSCKILSGLNSSFLSGRRASASDSLPHRLVSAMPQLASEFQTRSRAGRYRKHREYLKMEMGTCCAEPCLR